MQIVKNIKQKNIIPIILTLALLLLFIWSFFIEPNRLVITNYTIKDTDLSGIKIVFVSDFHVKPHQRERLKKVVQTINNQKADVVLSGGDFVSGHIETLSMSVNDIAQELKNINNFYTILGNHDEYIGVNKVIKQLKLNNINVLYNSNTKINIKGKEIYIAGIEYKPMNMIPILKSLENTKSPTIMLSHSPDEIDKIPDDVNLILSGHTHGGQIVIPFIGPVFTASKYHTKYAYGLVEENNMKIIITRGLGVSILPFRFNCTPEIVVIQFE